MGIPKAVEVLAAYHGTLVEHFPDKIALKYKRNLIKDNA